MPCRPSLCTCSALPLIQVILLVQTDVTGRVLMERRMADLTRAQLGMLEQLFPRHVIECMLSDNGNEGLGMLANSHDDVTVLFADVCGFTGEQQQQYTAYILLYAVLLFHLCGFGLIVRGHWYRQVQPTCTIYSSATWRPRCQAAAAAEVGAPCSLVAACLPASSVRRW